MEGYGPEVKRACFVKGSLIWHSHGTTLSDSANGIDRRKFENRVDRIMEHSISI